MSYKVIDFDDLAQDLQEHQEKVMFGTMDESMKADLEGMGADSMKRSGRLVTLHWKEGESDIIKKTLETKMAKYQGKLKHIGVMKKGRMVTAEIEMNEAKGRKAAFGTNRGDGFSFAVNIPTLDSNDFVSMPFGRQLGDLRKVQEWKKSAKSTHVGSKGKATLPAVRKWVKEVKPSEFYAKWKMDSPNYKDDSVEIFYKN